MQKDVDTKQWDTQGPQKKSANHGEINSNARNERNRKPQRKWRCTERHTITQMTHWSISRGCSVSTSRHEETQEHHRDAKTAIKKFETNGTAMHNDQKMTSVGAKRHKTTTRTHNQHSVKSFKTQNFLCFETVCTVIHFWGFLLCLWLIFSEDTREVWVCFFTRSHQRFSHVMRWLVHTVNIIDSARLISAVLSQQRRPKQG